SEREVHDNTSYTRVEIEKFTPPFMENVNDGLSASFFIKESKHEQVEDEEYFKRFLRHIDDDKFKNRLINLQPLDLALAQLALMSPCRYLSDGPVRSRIETSDRKIYKVEGADDPALMRIKEQLIDYNFAIRCEIFNDSETRSKLRNRFSLFKPLLYPSERDLEKWRSYEDLAEHLKPQVAVLPTIVTEVPTPEGSTRTSMTAYTYHQNARINPREFRGILFRVYSVGIGQEFADDYRYYSNDPVTLQQTFIEVYLDEGFQSIVNLDRESLYQGSNLFRHAHNVLKMYLKGIDIGIDSDATLDDFTTLKLGATAPPSGPDYDAAVARKREQAKVQFEESFILAEKKALSSIDPKNVGVIDKIKRSKPSARRVGIYRKRLDDVMRKEVIERVKADELVVKRVGSHNIAKVSLDNKRAIISIPEYKGTRRKLWDAIAILVALHIKDDKQRSEAMSFLWKIYLASEDTE
ncbi:MAG: hypothetical protein JRN68_11215, partial [Nitrososphaerota archaeon]|nr:hypothetical protein [Nitrososphaerota archaeon]